MIIYFLRRITPVPIKNLVRLTINCIEDFKKKCFASSMRKKHHSLIELTARKNKIKVVFLAIHESVWKVDDVFKRMLQDDYFDPLVLVCPYTDYGLERQNEDIDKCHEFFVRKGYPVLKAIKPDGALVKLDEINPDLVFFTNPHNLTNEEYYNGAFNKYLSCYVPYFYLVTSHGNDQSIYNQYFHNAMWKIFMPHDVALERAKKVSVNNAKNCVLTGFPACEPLVYGNVGPDPWYKTGGKKRVIFAPHHSIDGSKELNLSNFLMLADFFRDLVEIYKEDIQWCFKPHPILKSKLYAHPEWGKSRTDDYYNFWEKCDVSQLEEGDYESLFYYSDAMIHDSGSFLVEYLHLKKPVLYLINNNTRKNLNYFGRSALGCCTTGSTKDHVFEFLDQLLTNPELLKNRINCNSTYNQKINFLYKNESPSTKICNIIKSEIRGSYESKDSVCGDEC